MKIAIFPCNNGLGHIKRSLEIAQNINRRIKIDFFTKYDLDYNFKKKKNLFIKEIRNPHKLDEFKVPSYPKWVNYLDLKKYDVIYCDTLPELVLVRKKIIIFANFFWNKIFKLNNKIFKDIDRNLSSSKIFTNYLFYHRPSMRRKKSIKIGFFGKFIRKNYLENNNILISIGTAKLENSNNLLKHLKNQIMKNKNYNFYVDKKYFSYFKNIKNAFLAEHDKYMFKKISIAIIKPGFSLISECLKNGIPIFCFDNMQSAEFKHNSSILVKYKLGYKENNIKKLFDIALSKDKKSKIQLFYKYKNLKWNGEEAIINEIK